MTKVILDPTMRAKLNGLNGLLQVCDESGRTLGYFHPVVTNTGPGTQSPFSVEEVERRRQQRTGRLLGEILPSLKPT